MINNTLFSRLNDSLRKVKGMSERERERKNVCTYVNVYVTE